jgi:carbon-monoxide dehydrogenase large subunit
MESRYLGKRVLRVEDPDLVSGRGCYIDDVPAAGAAYAAFVRSDQAHARIKAIDVAAASVAPGVIAVFDARALGVAGRAVPQLAPSPLLLQDRTQHVLASEAVHYVGEAIAIVVANTRGLAEDAAALVKVEYEVLPHVADVATALDPGSPKAHEDVPNNRVATLRAKFGNIEKTFASTPHVFRERIVTIRGGAHSMETRGVVAAEDAFSGQLTVWSSTQVPFMLRRFLATFLGRDESRIRVAAPNIGGGFGPKGNIYAEEFAVVLAAMKLKRPVKWIEDRRENFLALHTQREQIWDLEVAADSNGRLVGVRGVCLHDNGAYACQGVVLPTTTIVLFPGPYALEAIDVTLESLFTNKVPTSPVRGAGRPSTNFVMERLVDRVARELKLDRAEVRRRSFVRKEQFPYLTGAKARDGRPISYDSGDYHKCLDLALERIGDFEARRKLALSNGRYLGLGIASYNEDTGIGPYEGAAVRIEPSGNLLVTTGAAAIGQGLHTALTQIAADVFDVPLEKVRIISGDTGSFPHGIGTIASRITALAGSSLHIAAKRVRDKAIKIAASMLEAAESDLELKEGRIRVVGTDRSVGLGEVAFKIAGMSGVPMPGGEKPGLAAEDYFLTQGLTFASGSSACEVEVDPGTGAVKILRFVAAHDCGNVINPMIVDGQVRGGVVHGVGNALHERMVFDAAAQPQTMNYGEYLLPIATDVPMIEVIHVESPSPMNPLGVKGAGEGGTIPATACIVSAIEDALKPFGITISEHPVTPQRLVELIEAAQRTTAA